MLALALVASTLLAAQDPATPPPAKVEEPKDSPAMVILKAADEATKAVRSVRYVADFSGTGVQAARVAVAHGTVLKAFENAEAEFMLIAGEGWFFSAGSKTNARTPYKAAFDGQNIIRLDPEKKLAYEGENAQQVLGPVFRLDMPEYGHPTPFQDEINGGVQELEGQTLVGDVLCDVVYVEYDIEGASPARWYFGVEDHLPRRVERIAPRGERAGALVLTLTELEANPTFSRSDFDLAIPEGYSKRAASGPGAPAPTSNPVGIGGGGGSGGGN